MRVTLTDLKRWPDRQGASVFYYALVVDDEGTRYPAHVMLDDIAVMTFGEGRAPGTYANIVEAMFERELRALVEERRLAPETSRKNHNVVIFVDDDHCEIRPGDIVVPRALERLTAAARLLDPVGASPPGP